MKTDQKYIYDLHTDHQTWTANLAFYADQLKIMQERLLEVSSKNTIAEVKIKVEQFQNRFLIQRNELDILRHDIKIAEEALQIEIKENPVAIDHRKVNDDASLRERADTYTQLFGDLRDDFNRFVAEVL
jgi:hypothetical protein